MHRINSSDSQNLWVLKSLFACCHIVPNLSSMSVFPDFLFLSQPTHIHPLYSVWIHHSHFRKANDPFWLPKLPASAAAWIPKITETWNNYSLHGQKMNPDPSEQWKRRGKRQMQLLQPFKTRDSNWAAAAAARWCTHTLPSNSNFRTNFSPQQPFSTATFCVQGVPRIFSEFHKPDKIQLPHPQTLLSAHEDTPTSHIRAQETYPAA